MTNQQNIQNLQHEERKKLKQIKKLQLDIETLQKLIKHEQKKVKAVERSATPDDIQRFRSARKRYHHIDYSANRFRVQYQEDGKRKSERFKSLDDAIKIRDEKLYGKYE